MQKDELASLQEQLRECVLFGLLFKAAMADLAVMHQLPLSLSYHVLLEGLSCWAEKQHIRLKRCLRQKGYELLASKKQDHLYCVQIRCNGYLQEAVYSIELLRAECQQRVRMWVTEEREVASETG